MTENDRLGREIVRQARLRGIGNRLAAIGNGGISAAQSSSSGTRVDGSGNVRRLFIPDIDPLDDANYYLGDGAIFEDSL